MTTPRVFTQTGLLGYNPENKHPSSRGTRLDLVVLYNSY